MGDRHDGASLFRLPVAANTQHSNFCWDERSACIPTTKSRLPLPCTQYIPPLPPPSGYSRRRRVLMTDILTVPMSPVVRNASWASVIKTPKNSATRNAGETKGETTKENKDSNTVGLSLKNNNINITAESFNRSCWRDWEKKIRSCSAGTISDYNLDCLTRLYTP